MATYISTIKFTQKGLEGIHESAKRANAFKAAAKKMGVKVTATYWTLGYFDGVIVFEAQKSSIRRAKSGVFETAMPTLSNLLTDLPENVPDELFQTILDKPNIRIERIVSLGHATPEGGWFDQETDEWVLLVQGAARLRFEDGAVEMLPGDYVHIAAHRRHRVEWTDGEQPTIWLAVHYNVKAPDQAMRSNG